jgi:hypothetical protein
MELISRRTEGILSYCLLNYSKERTEEVVEGKCSHLRIMNRGWQFTVVQMRRHETKIRVRIS